MSVTVGSSLQSLRRGGRPRPRRSGLLAAAGAILALLLGLGASAAQAAPILAAAFPSGPMTIEIHKFEQPAQPGGPADGLEITDPSQLPESDPVPNAEFTATRVPGIDLSTAAGQQQAAALTIEEAAQRIAAGPTDPPVSDTTDGSGNATITVPGSGLYYLQETSTPAGFVSAAPFLVALPLTNPETRDGWLTTVHVYPKNARAGVTLGVADENAVALGDVVHWQARADIPSQSGFSSYSIRQKIDPGLQLQGGAGGFTVALDCPSCPPLTEGSDYDVSVDSATGEYVIEFTPAGRAALAAAIAAHPSATVTVDFDARVLSEGELRNEVSLEIGGSVVASDSAVTKWGGLGIEVRERGNPSHLIPGARFQLFLSAEDAAAGRNPIAVNGVDEWTTDSNGRITINGLRFSNFANGRDLQPGDPLFREYFVVLTRIPDGYTGAKAPIALTVTSAAHIDVALVELQRSGSGGGGGGLPVTGAQLTGIAMLAMLLLGGGAMFLLRRRDREREDETRSP